MYLLCPTYCRFIPIFLTVLYINNINSFYIICKNLTLNNAQWLQEVVITTKYSKIINRYLCILITSASKYCPSF